MIQVADSVIVDCCNGMLDCNSLEEMLNSWDARILEQFGESMDREHAKQKIRERVEKYDKYSSLEGKI